MEEYSDRAPADVAWYPMVPIRDVVIFPFTKVAFKIGRQGSVRALEQALAADRTIFLATQHDATIDEPSPDQIYGVGTLGRILQSQKQDNGQIKNPVRNLRFNQSVLAMLAPWNVEAIGQPQRNFPSMVPPLRLSSFTFTSISDAI